MKKPEFITKLENEKLFSYVDLPNLSGDIPKKLKDKKYVPLYSERTSDNNGKMVINQYIVKSAQGFYLYFERQSDKELWSTTIYFEESKESELQFFVNNFIKTYNDATTDNRTTQGKN